MSIPPLEIYHVTNITDDSDEMFDLIRCNVMHSSFRDGLLFNCKASCFSVTKYQAQLPTFSPYPNNAADSTKHKRVSIFVDPTNYRKFKMAETKTQIHFLFLEKYGFENDIADMLRFMFPSRENDGWEEWSKNDYYYDEKIFVNVMFLHDIKVNENDFERGRSVPKKSPKVKSSDKNPSDENPKIQTPWLFHWFTALKKKQQIEEAQRIGKAQQIGEISQQMSSVELK